MALAVEEAAEAEQLRVPPAELHAGLVLAQRDDGAPCVALLAVLERFERCARAVDAGADGRERRRAARRLEALGEGDEVPCAHGDRLVRRCREPQLAAGLGAAGEVARRRREVRAETGREVVGEGEGALLGCARRARVGREGIGDRLERVEDALAANLGQERCNGELGDVDGAEGGDGEAAEADEARVEPASVEGQERRRRTSADTLRLDAAGICACLGRRLLEPCCPAALHERRERRDALHRGRRWRRCRVVVDEEGRVQVGDARPPAELRRAVIGGLCAR